LNSAEWFFRFFIPDHFVHHPIKLDEWSEILRPNPSSKAWKSDAPLS